MRFAVRVCSSALSFPCINQILGHTPFADLREYDQYMLAETGLGVLENEARGSTKPRLSP